MKKCKQGYYYCHTDKKCKRIPGGYRVGLGGYLRREREEEKSEDNSETETKKNGNGNVSNSNGNGNGGNGNGSGSSGSNGGNGGGVSEGLSSKYMKSIVESDGKSSKDKGYSLRDWFKGGGWKQTGGKYDGKPCAKQPGQKTKPYCRDADDRASMSKDERNKRAAKKRAEDPNPTRKGQAKIVTQESHSNWRKDLEQLDEFLAGKPGDGYIGHPNLDIKNPLAKKQVKKEVLPGSKGGGAVNRVGAALGDRNMRYNKMLNQSFEPEGELVDEGKKDACYNKVKSRYDVWPSAYASGALVKCRKVGAKNWGNKTKKEEFELGESKKDKLKEISSQLKGASKLHSQQSKKVSAVADAIEEAKKCWPGYEKKGTKKMFGKTYNNCVKKEEYVQEFASKATVDKMKREGGNASSFSTGGMTAPNNGGLKGGNQHLRNGTKKKIQDDYQFSNWRDDFQAIEYETTNLITNQDVLGEDWTKKSGKDPEGGLNEKGRKSYERENPGSDLKRPSKKVGNKRRSSFCARMKGMKKKLTSSKTANDPNSRINKSLRAWNC